MLVLLVTGVDIYLAEYHKDYFQRYSKIQSKKSHRLHVEGARVMLSSRLSCKNTSSLHHSVSVGPDVSYQGAESGNPSSSRYYSRYYAETDSSPVIQTADAANIYLHITCSKTSACTPQASLCQGFKL